MDAASLSPGLVETEVKIPGGLETTIFLFFRLLPFFIIFFIIIFIIGILIKIVISKSSRSSTKKIASFSLTAVLSIIVIFLSLYIPKTIDDYNALNSVACGFPSPFLMFISSRSLPDYAWTDNCIGWLGEPGGAARIQFLWLPFILNVAIVFGFITGVFYIVQILHQKCFQGKIKKGKK